MYKSLFLLGYLTLSLLQHFKIVSVDTDYSFEIKIIQECPNKTSWVWEVIFFLNKRWNLSGSLFFSFLSFFCGMCMCVCTYSALTQCVGVPIHACPHKARVVHWMSSSVALCFTVFRQGLLLNWIIGILAKLIDWFMSFRKDAAMLVFLMWGLRFEFRFSFLPCKHSHLLNAPSL